MKSIIEEILEPEGFDAFINEQMKLSTYVPEWEKEMDTDYSESKAFNEVIGTYSAAYAASVVEKNADKPLQNMPNLGELNGTLARMADRFQLDNDRLDRVLFLEGRYRGRAANLTETQKLSEYGKITKFLFDPYEKAAIAPHKRIDQLYFQGLSDGKFTVSLANNPKGIQFELPLGIPTYQIQNGGVAWVTVATSKPVQDILYVQNILRGKGKIVTKLQMTPNTFQKIAGSASVKNLYTLKVPAGEIAPGGIVTLDMINQYFGVIGLPAIELMEKFLAKPDGTAENMFKEDRVVFRTANKVAKLLIADTVESKLPLPNRVYTTYKDNLISQYRTEQGQFIDYEMWGLPIFTGRDDFAILKVDEVASS
ncbi:hypothetical protein GCM10027592_29500 [Spirosoma flavus]